MRVTAVACMVLLLAGCTGAGRPTAEPTPAWHAVPAPTAGEHAPMTPLHGRALTGRTGLRFLVPGLHGAVLLDIDRGTSTPIAGLPRGRMIDYLVRAGGSAVLTARCERCRPLVYVVPPGAVAARRIADGIAVAATPGQKLIWLRTEQGGRCALGLIDLSGRRRSAPRPIGCDVFPTGTTTQGVMAAAPGQDGSLPETVILRSGDLRTVFRGPWVLGVIGTTVLSGNPDDQRGPLRLLDVGTGAIRWFPLPTTPGSLSDGIVSPDGRWIAVRFGNPAWPGPRQLLDVWLLDTRALTWQHVPSMPAPVSLKETNLTWTDDNRLVVLGRFYATPDVYADRTKDVLAIYRPGTPSLAIRPVRLPTQGTPVFTLH